jgi:hypothetical protein
MDLINSDSEDELEKPTTSAVVEKSPSSSEESSSR